MRYKRVLISPRLLSDMVKYGTEKTKSEGIPATAKLRNAGFDVQAQCFYLIYQDDSFEEVQEGVQVPILEVMQTKIYEQENR